MYSTPKERAFFLKQFSKEYGSNQPSLAVPDEGSNKSCYENLFLRSNSAVKGKAIY